jgi:hypothetical protein
MKRTLIAAAAMAAGLLVQSNLAKADSPATSSTAVPSQGPAPVNEPGKGGAFSPPPYTLVRWNEDYTYLRDPAKRTDPLDPIKYMPFNDSGSVYLSLGGQFRERYEYFNHANFGSGVQDQDGYLLHRLLLNADLHLGDNVRVFGQFKSAMEDGRSGGPRATDGDESDVQQLFIDGNIPLGEKNGVTIRFGRQDLLYGAQRLISPLDWTNVRRTFEGLKVSSQLGNHNLDAFWVRPVIVDNEEPNNGDGDSSFAGIYDTISLPDVLPKANTKLELYGLALNQTARPAVATAGGIGVDADTYTLGARFSTNPKPWDLDVEADYQFGQSGSGSISAWSIAVEGGYTFLNCPMKPRPYLGFDIASGDDDPTNPDKGTFNQLFPLGHAYFGYIDVIGRQNIIDLHPGVELLLLENQTWAKKITLRADYHMFWRENSNDAVYNAAGGVLRAASGSDEMYVGSEVDLLINWQIDRHWSAYFGYSHFFAGQFLQNTGPSDDIDFFYAAAMYTF